MEDKSDIEGMLKVIINTDSQNLGRVRHKYLNYNKANNSIKSEGRSIIKKIIKEKGIKIKFDEFDE